MSKRYLQITNPINTGGNIYEYSIYDQLRNKIDINCFKLDPEYPSFLRPRKLQYLYQLNRLDTSPYDVLLVNKVATHCGILKKPGEKILILHHIDPSSSSHPVVDKYFDNYLLKNLNKFSLVITVSEYWKQFLSKRMDGRKVRIIYNSFDINKINQALNDFDAVYFKKKHHIPLDKIIVYGGNSLRVKGIGALTKLLKDQKKFHIITSGKKDIDYDNQHLNLDYEDYLRLLKCADVSILLPDLKEGWNRCAHESILCGTPVIGKKSGGLGELLEKTKQSVITGSEYADELISLINKTVSNKDNLLFGQKVLSKYDMHYFSREWLNVLNEAKIV